VVAPWLVAGEQHPVVAEATPVDLGGQPSRREPDGPGQVGVDALAGRDPVEEPRADQLDVAAHPAAEMHQVEAHVVAEPVDELADLVDVGGGARRGVHVDGQVVLPGAAKIGLQARVVDAAAEQEAQLQRPHPALPRQPERLHRARPVALLGRDPEPAPDPVVALGGLDHQVVEAERHVRVGHAVVGQDQRRSVPSRSRSSAGRRRWPGR
jgi:hypothetical protein